MKIKITIKFYSQPPKIATKIKKTILTVGTDVKQLEFSLKGFPGGSEVKVSACNAGDLSSIPGSGRSPGEGNGNPLQYSCLENPMEEGAW